MKSAYEVKCKIARDVEEARPIAKKIVNEFTDDMYFNSLSKAQLDRYWVKIMMCNMNVDVSVTVNTLMAACAGILRGLNYTVEEHDEYLTINV